jgi:hypothetical protein
VCSGRSLLLFLVCRNIHVRINFHFASLCLDADCDICKSSYVEAKQSAITETTLLFVLRVKAISN